MSALVLALPNFAPKSDEPANDTELLGLLTLTDKKAVRPCGSNIEMVIRFASELRGRVRWNEITRAIEITGGRFKTESPATLDTALKNWMETEFKLFAAREEVGAQLLRAAQRWGSYDPVAEYLGALVWDRTPRIDTWLTTYCGVVDSDYTRKIGARWLISGACRGLEPGEKVDTVLILKGPQGYKKSTTFDVLGGEWFTDSPLDLGNKDSRITASATWIVELAELAALGQRGLETHKAFLAAHHDKVRPPYARADVRFARHCVFGGTTNSREFLIDSTGNRRYWVAEVTRHVDTDALRRDRDQLWAEAAYRFNAQERWWFEAHEQVTSDLENTEHEIENPWVDAIRDWAARRSGKPFKLAEVAADALGIKVADLDRHKRAVSTALRAAGYDSVQVGPAKARERVWSLIGVSGAASTRPLSKFALISPT